MEVADEPPVFDHRGPILDSHEVFLLNGDGLGVSAPEPVLLHGGALVEVVPGQVPLDRQPDVVAAPGVFLVELLEVVELHFLKGLFNSHCVVLQRQDLEFVLDVWKLFEDLVVEVIPVDGKTLHV